MLIAYLLLFGFLALGIYLASWNYHYEISHARKLGAAAGFVIGDVVADFLPIPLVGLIIPFAVLWATLMDDTFDRETVRKVFFFSLFTGVVGLVGVHFLFR